MYRVISKGNDISSALNYVNEIPEGKKGKIEITFNSPPSDSAVNLLASKLSNGATVLTTGNKITISWKQGFAWLSAIIAAIISISTLATAITGWKILRELTPLSKDLLSVSALIVVIVVAYFLWKKGYLGG